MKRNQSGFTLIEIAIVLVIIGLLLGGVLKGQELINSAKVKNLATDFRNVPVYIYGYQDKFRALPGDDIQAVSHVGAAAGHNGNGDGLIGGAWDSITLTDESQYFWEHIRLAGLAAGPTSGGDLLPTNSVGGVIGITSSANFTDPSAGTAANPKINGSYIICSSGILGKYAKQLDLQMDDSNPIGGSIREFSSSNSRPSTLTVPTLTNGMIDDNQTYTVCMGV
ncbi:prepilin-type N-terminal cleavage/methylation domain-containing protein [Sideroxydans sp. CL21]|uniref:prepilin-type N-terminal cleavage/methylation domain-containing protein n=1 Tax=Sideroxydans sp. CL21 TaxID=2600596 RepID=UPI0012A9C41C|nr:prepilin-type N-terminal cleavage/methylation domain-containing protein [Sideroxydans sp. CL21]VVC82499.1 hypothetical protein [Sideroxydans sp. CL21]